MRIHAIRGYIHEEGPNLAEAIAVQLWRGTVPILERFFKEPLFSSLHLLCSERRNPRSPRVPQPPDDLSRPWLSPFDHIFELRPPHRRLKYIYVFGNERDVCGCDVLEQIPHRVRMCLLYLSRRTDVRTLAMMHTMTAQRREQPVFYDRESARYTVEALEDWASRFPGHFDDAYLIDPLNAFREFVGASDPKLASESQDPPNV